MIQILYDKLFRLNPPEQEWSKWHEMTQEKISNARSGGRIFELNDPTEIKYYQWVADEILLMIGSVGGPILEVGGGSGALSLELSKRSGCMATIFDFSDIALEYAQIVFGEQGHEIARGDATDIRFSDGSFSLVHSVGLIEHFSDNTIDKMVGEMSRLTKKGGHVFLAVPNYFSPDMIGLWIRHGKGSERYIPVKKLVEITSRAGLSVINSGHSEFSFSEDLGRFIPRKLEGFLGRCGLGFLNYVVCRR